MKTACTFDHRLSLPAVRVLTVLFGAVLALLLAASTGATAWAQTCPSGEVRCGTGCMPASATCCGNGYCSAATPICGNNNNCCRANESPCGSGCIPRGHTCCGQFGCPQNAPVCGGTGGCPANSCCERGGGSSGGGNNGGGNGGQCPNGEVPCGGGCMPAGSVCCGGSYCPSDFPVCGGTNGCTPGRCCQSGSAPPPEPREVCLNTCVYAFDGECDDGLRGSVYDLCDPGTDCADCGPRTTGTDSEYEPLDFGCSAGRGPASSFTATLLIVGGYLLARRRRRGSA